MIIATGFVIAAAVGTVTRAVSSRKWDHNLLPVGTLAVNISGAGLLGLVAGAKSGFFTIVGVGGLGSLTTFSSLVLQVVQLARAGRLPAAIAYLAVTISAGVAAAGLGLALAS